MSPRRKVNREIQRRARALARQRGISYMQALDSIHGPGVGAAGDGGPATAANGWLKGLHYRYDGWTIPPGQETWVSDISRHDDDGNRVYRKDGVPWGEPSWKIGDHVGLYFGGTLRVPILIEVIAPPRFDPEFVQKYNDGGEPDAGDRWPWVTEVRGLRAVSLAQAPTVDDFEVEHASLHQLSRKLLTPNQLSALEQALR